MHCPAFYQKKAFLIFIFGALIQCLVKLKHKSNSKFSLLSFKATVNWYVISCSLAMLQKLGISDWALGRQGPHLIWTTFPIPISKVVGEPNLALGRQGAPELNSGDSFLRATLVATFKTSKGWIRITKNKSKLYIFRSAIHCSGSSHYQFRMCSFGFNKKIL